MAVLNAWQKIDRVLTGLPFGDGSAGNTTISADPNTRATGSGTAALTALTLGTAILSNGDVFVIIQTTGTGNYQWEINKVASGGGTTSITCSQALQYTYGTGAQVIKFSLYDAVTLGSFTIPTWGGSTGGIAVICGKTSIGGTGTITGNGKGYRGGAKRDNNDGPANQGEGGPGAGTTSTAANGNGGGGGNQAAGGGGGHGAAGGNGGNAVLTGGTGGAASGAADMTTLSLGGGGGGSAHGGGGSNNANGSPGGGALILISKSIDISGITVVNLYGTDGGAGTSRGSGGGGGGAGLLVCQTATLGTNKIVATGGAGGTGGDANANGGAGGTGRIAVHHSGTVTGTTNPTFNDTTDSSLVESIGVQEANYSFFM